MKGISPMIATVLLIGFTVAVGAILAVWFSTFTKTQTASVSKSSSCSTTTIDVSTPVVNDDNVYVLVQNNGPETINVKNVRVVCGSSTNSTSDPSTLQNLKPGESNIIQITGLSGCDVNPPRVIVLANCTTGGTVTGECSSGAC